MHTTGLSRSASKWDIQRSHFMPDIFIITTIIIIIIIIVCGKVAPRWHARLDRKALVLTMCACYPATQGGWCRSKCFFLTHKHAHAMYALWVTAFTTANGEEETWTLWQKNSSETSAILPFEIILQSIITPINYGGCEIIWIRSHWRTQTEIRKKI